MSKGLITVELSAEDFEKVKNAVLDAQYLLNDTKVMVAHIHNQITGGFIDGDIQTLISLLETLGRSFELTELRGMEGLETASRLLCSGGKNAA